MPQLDRPPLPTYEELFLTPPKSRSQSTFDIATSGFPASPCLLDSSTPRFVKVASSAFDASPTLSTSSLRDRSNGSFLGKDVSFDHKHSGSFGSLDKNGNNLDSSAADLRKSNSFLGDAKDLRGLPSKNDAAHPPEAADSSMSVKERAQKLNKLHSESELNPSSSRRTASLLSASDLQRPGGRRSVAAGNADLPVHLTKELRKWMVLSATANYHPIAKMISENKSLVHFKDFVTGYTPLHWAAKSGQVELVKLIAGHGAAVNAKSNGGYTPLHLAFQQNHKETALLLVNVYKADPHVRDYAGKTPTSHNPELANALGLAVGILSLHSSSSSSSLTAASTPTSPTTKESGLSRWVGLRSSGARNETKNAGSSSSSSSSSTKSASAKIERKLSKQQQLERRESKLEDKWGSIMTSSTKRKQTPTKSPKSDASKLTDAAGLEKTTQITFV